MCFSVSTFVWIFLIPPKIQLVFWDEVMRVNFPILINKGHPPPVSKGTWEPHWCCQLSGLQTPASSLGLSDLSRSEQKDKAEEVASFPPPQSPASGSPETGVIEAFLLKVRVPKKIGVVVHSLIKQLGFQV